MRVVLSRQNVESITRENLCEGCEGGGGGVEYNIDPIGKRTFRIFLKKRKGEEGGRFDDPLLVRLEQTLISIYTAE